MPLAVPGCSWLLLAASGCSWLYPFPRPPRGHPLATSPPRLRGGMFVNFSVLNHGCQLCQRMAKYTNSIGSSYQKYTTSGYVCEILGPHKVDKHTFLEKEKSTFCCTSVLASLDLSGQLLSLKIDLKTSINQPDAPALTEDAINWQQNPNNINIFVRHFPK